MTNITVLTNTLLKETQERANQISNFAKDCSNEILNKVLFPNYPYSHEFWDYKTDYDEELEEVLKWKDAMTVVEYLDYVNDIWELYELLEKSFEVKENYIILEKQFYYSGSVAIGNISCIKDNTIYVFAFDDIGGYGCYTIPFYDALNFRGDKYLLVDGRYEGYPFFADLLGDSDVLESFTCIQGDTPCDSFTNRETCLKFLEGKADELLGEKLSPSSLIFKQIMKIIGKYIIPTQEVLEDSTEPFIAHFKDNSSSTKKTFKELINDYVDFLKDLLKANVESDDFEVVRKIIIEIEELKEIETFLNKDTFNEKYVASLKDFKTHMNNVLSECEGNNFEKTYDFKLSLKDETIDLTFDAPTFEELETLIDNLIDLY